MYVGIYVGVVWFPPWLRSLNPASSDPHWIAAQDTSSMLIPEMLGLAIMLAIPFAMLGFAALVKWALWSLAFPRLMPRMVEQVRSNCLERGLLLLAIEHQPHDRLKVIKPPVRSWAETLGLRAKKVHDAGAMEERFKWIQERYAKMCKVLRLQPFSPAMRWLLILARSTQALVLSLGFGCWIWWLTSTPAGRTVLDSERLASVLWYIACGLLLWIASLLPKLSTDLVDLAVKSVVAQELEPSRAATAEVKLPAPPGYEHTLHRRPAEVVALK
jgi:hypothetical protein